MYNLYAKFEKILEICKQFSQGLVDERGNVLRRSPTPKFSDLEVIALPYGVEGFATPKHLSKRGRHNGQSGRKTAIQGD